MDFSIIVPTFNRWRQLNKCLNRLYELDYPKDKYEIIVVDDGSHEMQTPPHNNGMPKIMFLRRHHAGAGAARNWGISHARGRWIAFTDDDCIVEANWLRKLKQGLCQRDIAAVGGSVLNPDSNYIALASYIQNFSAWLPKGKQRFVKDIPTANIAYKKDAIANMQFPEHLRGNVYEDSLFNHMLSQKILFCPEIKVTHHTWHKGDGLKKFFRMQKKAAAGFVLGGNIVHGQIGSMLVKFPELNLLCPRIVMVAVRCIKKGYFLRFLYALPLILAGEFYRGILVHKMIRFGNRRQT